MGKWLIEQSYNLDNFKPILIVDTIEQALEYEQVFFDKDHQVLDPNVTLVLIRSREVPYLPKE